MSSTCPNERKYKATNSRSAKISKQNKYKENSIKTHYNTTTEYQSLRKKC